MKSVISAKYAKHIIKECAKKGYCAKIEQVYSLDGTYRGDILVRGNNKQLIRETAYNNNTVLFTM